MTQQELQDLLDESMQRALTYSIEPITTKLENLSIKLDTLQQDTQQSTNNAHLRLSCLFSFRPPLHFLDLSASRGHSFWKN